MTEAPTGPTIVECRVCQGSVIANPVGDYETMNVEDDAATQFGLFRCSRCSAPFLTRREGGPEVDDRDGSYYTGYGPWKMLHPSAPSLPLEVPEHIRRGYLEAAACFGAGSNTATAIMGRRTIEAICLDKGATKGTLAKMVKELREKGIIAPQLLEWADQLRDVGNEAAHKVDEFTSREDAQDVVEFTRAIVEYVYVFTDAFDRFKARRQKKLEKQSPSEGSG